GHDYVQAEHYIRKSLTLEPGVPATLDSLGWVEYKQGNLDSARKHLEQAYKARQGPEIAAHLGEVLWQLGQQKAAREIWGKAASIYPDNKILQETMERFLP